MSVVQWTECNSCIWKREIKVLIIAPWVTVSYCNQNHRVVMEVIVNSVQLALIIKY